MGDLIPPFPLVLFFKKRKKVVPTFNFVVFNNIFLTSWLNIKKLLESGFAFKICKFRVNIKKDETLQKCKVFVFKCFLV